MRLYCIFGVHATVSTMFTIQLSYRNISNAEWSLILNTYHITTIFFWCLLAINMKENLEFYFFLCLILLKNMSLCKLLITSYVLRTSQSCMETLLSYCRCRWIEYISLNLQPTNLMVTLTYHVRFGARFQLCFNYFN